MTNFGPQGKIKIFFLVCSAKKSEAINCFLTSKKGHEVWNMVAQVMHEYMPGRYLDDLLEVHISHTIHSEQYILHCTCI